MRRLGWLSLFGGTCAIAGGVYLATGQGLPCPFLVVTGWLCPLCGASRMGAAVLRGDLAAAWGWNPFVLVLAVLGVAGWLWTALRIVLRRSAELPGPAAAIEAWSPGGFVGTLVASGLVFMVLRNTL